MILGKVCQLDQKNRVHLPYDMLEACEIQHNSEVEVTCDEFEGAIVIRKRQKPSQLREVILEMNK